VESPGELAWFRGEVLRSIVRPRSFAKSLAREHFGLAGVLIVVRAGIALSLTIDALVLTTKAMAPATFVARLTFESLLLGARLAVSAAAVAFVVFLGVGTSGMALQFRFFDPPDVDTAFAQAGAIAATWQVGAAPP